MSITHKWEKYESLKVNQKKYQKQTVKDFLFCYPELVIHRQEGFKSCVSHWCWCFHALTALDVCWKIFACSLPFGFHGIHVTKNSKCRSVLWHMRPTYLWYVLTCVNCGNHFFRKVASVGRKLTVENGKPEVSVCGNCRVRRAVQQPGNTGKIPLHARAGTVWKSSFLWQSEDRINCVGIFQHVFPDHGQWKLRFCVLLAGFTVRTTTRGSRKWRTQNFRKFRKLNETVLYS